MAGYLIAEEGALIGLTLSFEEGEEWIVGRDPDVATFVLEDPMVSRRHLVIRNQGDAIYAENLSTVNPANVNGEPIKETIKLNEGDVVQIGATFFKFTETAPETPLMPMQAATPAPDQEIPLSKFSFGSAAPTRFVIKVISGPNTGAEFGMEPETTYVLGKDAETCDIVFQDLSVSREHARLSINSNGEIDIEDLESRNGILVNGKPISEKTRITAQDLVGLGTTSFLVIDRLETRETIFAPPSAVIHPTADTTEEEEAAIKADLEEADKVARKGWKQMIVPTRHLVIASLFGILLIIGMASFITLFKSQPVEVVKRDEIAEIRKTIARFPVIEFTYTPASGTLFLVGHVTTSVDHQELIYLLEILPFVTSIEDNVVIDELVWEDTNALLMRNPAWRGVTLTGPNPGQFLLRGYVESSEVATELFDWMNRNFSFLNRLENRVVVDQVLEVEIQSLLVEQGFGGVLFQFSSGELILTGGVDESSSRKFKRLIAELKQLNGVRQVKNFVVLTTKATASIDLTNKFRVTGSSKLDGVSEYVVIGGRILSQGDTLDGMVITSISPSTVFLEKDGLKYKINYNQQ